jgi:hypothetical protein
MTTTDDLDEIMKQTNNSEYIENTDENKKSPEIKNKTETEPNSEKNLQPTNDSQNNEENNKFEELDENLNEPIE